MYFDINQYAGRFAMHCKTEKEAKSFCSYLHEHGRKWCLGNSYKDSTYWYRYTKNMVYHFNEGTYSNVDYCKGHNYTILEWEDFMKQTFTKADLKTGDVVKMKNGIVGIINRDLDMIILQEKWLDLEDLSEDLKFTHNRRRDEEWDIVEVRHPNKKSECQFDAIKYGFGTLVYKHQVEEMTLEQVCKLLGKEIKIIKG